MNDISKPSIGLGTFPFSNVFSDISQDTAEEIVETFVNLGGSYVETAPVYPIAQVELKPIVSGALRDKLFVATKCVTGSNESGEKVRSGKRDFIQWQVDAELTRLGLDHLDLVQAHAVPADVEIQSLAESLQELKDQGKALHIGVSNVNREQLERALTVAEVEYVQNRFSFLHRREHTSIQSLAAEKGIVLNPYQVIERGLLTSSPTGPNQRREKDLRNSKHEYRAEAFSVVRKWVDERLVPISEQANISVEAMVIAWTIGQPTQMMPVVGVTNPNQLTEAFAGARYKLSTQTSLDLEEAFESLSSQIDNEYGLSIDEFRGL